MIICSPNSILAYMHLHYLTDNAHKIGDGTDELQKKIEIEDNNKVNNEKIDS